MKEKGCEIMKFWLVVYEQPWHFTTHYHTGYTGDTDVDTNYYSRLRSRWVKANSKLEAYNIAMKQPFIQEEGGAIVHIEELGDVPEEVKK